MKKSVIQNEEISPDPSETANNSETVIDPIVSGVSTKLIINDDKDDGKITEQQQQVTFEFRLPNSYSVSSH